MTTRVMRSNRGVPFRLSGIGRKLRAPSIRVISNGYKRWQIGAPTAEDNSYDRQEGHEFL
jgi:hypothetical protein